jgi:hypothetical protein
VIQPESPKASAGSGTHRSKEAMPRLVIEYPPIRIEVNEKAVLLRSQVSRTFNTVGVAGTGRTDQHLS